MKFGTFYLLSQDTLQENDAFNYIKKLIFTLTIKKWRSGKSILIACNNKFQAQKIDELLWTYDKNTFLPHNLFSKNTDYSPIIICWTQHCCNHNISKNILINLMQININFFFHFNEIIDFVPVAENLKKLARHRYQLYKKSGFQLYVETHAPIL